MLIDIDSRRISSAEPVGTEFDEGNACQALIIQPARAIAAWRRRPAAAP